MLRVQAPARVEMPECSEEVSSPTPLEPEDLEGSGLRSTGNCLRRSAVGAAGELASLCGAEGVFCVVDGHESHLRQRVDKGLSLQTVWGLVWSKLPNAPRNGPHPRLYDPAGK